MPIRQMTQQEVDDLFGDGVIHFGVKPQLPLMLGSKNLVKESQHQNVLPKDRLEKQINKI